MKDAVQGIQKEIATSQRRVLELEAKLAKLPPDAGPETVGLYRNLLAKEKKFQEKMTRALAPPPVKRKSRLPLILICLLIIFFIYQVGFR